MRYKVGDKVVSTIEIDGVWEVVKVDKVNRFYLAVYYNGKYISDKLRFFRRSLEDNTRLLTPLEKAIK